MRYSGPFFKWTREELKQIDPRIRKLMTVYQVLYPRDDVDRLYVSRKEGGRGLTSIDVSIQQLKDYIEKNEGRLITATRNNTESMRIARTTMNRKKKGGGKHLYGRFKRLINELKKTWMLLRNGNLKREIESLLIVTTKNTIRTNHIQVRIDKTQ